MRESGKLCGNYVMFPGRETNFKQPGNTPVQCCHVLIGPLPLRLPRPAPSGARRRASSGPATRVAARSRASAPEPVRSKAKPYLRAGVGRARPGPRPSSCPLALAPSSHVTCCHGRLTESPRHPGTGRQAASPVTSVHSFCHIDPESGQ